MCYCLVHHPDLQSKEWQAALSNLRQTIDHGDGNLIPLLAEQLFGDCPDRKEKVNG